MRWKITALGAGVVAAGALAVPVAAQASPRPAVLASTYKWDNGGSYMKDEGAGNIFEMTTNKAVSSNFTRIDGTTKGGVAFYAYEDGSGNCMEVAHDNSTSSGIIAAACDNGAAQKFSDPSPVSNLGDFNNNVSVLMTDASNIVLMLTPGAGQSWSLV